MKKPSESDLIRQCLDLLALKGVYCWRSNNVAVYDPARKRYRSFVGLKGVSDILGIWHDGRLLAIEGKSATGRRTPEQKLFAQNIAKRGGIALLVRDVGELMKALEDLP